VAALACFALINDYPTVAAGVVVAMASVAGIFIFFRNRSGTVKKVGSGFLNDGISKKM
jgi:RNase P/RNase MRP subunit POP5